MNPSDNTGENPPARTRRRRTIGDYQERKFWETCVHVAMSSENAFDAIRKADTCLESWRARWAQPKPTTLDEAIEKGRLDYKRVTGQSE